MDPLIDRPLQALALHHQPEGIQQNLWAWQDENHGIACYMQAAKDIAEGKKVTFALCKHEPHKTPIVKEVITFAMGKGSPRYCGEDRDPNGAGSYALIPSWYDYCKDPMAIACALAQALCNPYRQTFRIR